MTRTVRGAWWLSLMCLCATALTGCATTRGGAPAGPERLSATLSPSVYYSEGRILFLGVDTKATSLTRGGEMFPLGVVVANNGGSSITLRIESLILEDDAGTRYPLVSYEEYQEKYRRSKSDRTLAGDLESVLRTRFISFGFMPLRFFPAKDSARGRLVVREIGRRQLARGYVYFPMPQGGVRGKVFTLLAKVDEHPETFVVRFKVR